MTNDNPNKADSDTGPLFPLGACVATPGAIRALSDGEGGDWRPNAAVYLARHRNGDWGDVLPEDARENELSVREGFRVVSSYEVAGERIWIITEADRSSTTILLPDEYWRRGAAAAPAPARHPDRSPYATAVEVLEPHLSGLRAP